MRFQFTCGLAMLLAAAVFALNAAAQEKTEKVQVVANDLKLDVPATWKKGNPTSQMRAAEFQIPASEEGKEGAELVVYYFDGGPTGGVRANVQRWIDQFHEDGREHTLVQGKSRAGEYVLVNISGTYKKPDGPPMAQKTIDTPGSRVIGVVLKTEVDGSEEWYFLKLAGPDAVVAGAAEDLRAAIGVEKDSEKPMKLDDAKS
jgi:gluconolactonase